MAVCIGDQTQGFDVQIASINLSVCMDSPGLEPRLIGERSINLLFIDCQSVIKMQLLRLHKQLVFSRALFWVQQIPS